MQVSPVSSLVLQQSTNQILKDFLTHAERDLGYLLVYVFA